MNALRQQINKNSARAEDSNRTQRRKSSGMGLNSSRSQSATSVDSKWRLKGRSTSISPPLELPPESRSRKGSQVSTSSIGSGHLDDSASPSYTSTHSRESTSSSRRSTSSQEPRMEEAVRRRLASFFFWDPSNRSQGHRSGESREHSIDPELELNVPTDLEPPPAPQAMHTQPSTVPFPMLRSRSSYSGKNLSIGVSDANSRKGVLGPSTPTLFVDGISDSPRSRRRTEESGTRSRSSSLGLSFGFGYKSSPSSASVARHSSSSDELKWRQELPLPPPPTAGFGVQRDADTTALGLDPAAVRYADHLHALGYTRNKHVCALLAKESRESTKFNNMVMQAFIIRMMRFDGEPLDMSLRKLLFRVALPQETQQIERVLQAFSALWHYENPGLFSDVEQVLFVVFSLVILHTDMFNRSVKHKMPKADYLQYAYIDGVAPEILEYFYDNITATAFREDDENSVPPIAPPSPNASSVMGVDPSPTQTPSDHLVPPVPPIPPLEDSHSVLSKRSGSLSWTRDGHTDPYPYLLENRLDSLRPALTSIVGESRCGTIPIVSTAELEAIEQRFKHSSASIQLVSQRSRPDAYIDGNADAVLEAQSRPGIVEISVVMHGVLLRREPKKMLAVSKPASKEWGAVLTESRLYLFKNAAFVKLMATAANGSFKASMDTLNQATTFSMRDMAAVTHVRHHENKFEFMLVDGGRDSGHQQWFGVESENELRDWVQTINLAATQATFNFTLVRPVFPSDDDAAEDAEPVKERTPASTIVEQMEEVDRQLRGVKDQIQWYMRTFRHLRILAPIHQRTRETLVFAAGRYSSKCDAAFVKETRLQCYKNVLALASAAASQVSEPQD